MGRRAGLKLRICGAALALLALCAPAAAVAETAFAGWAAIVVAGDWRGATGGPTAAFDNARRDVAAALGARGFQSDRLRQFSVRPEGETGGPAPLRATPKAIYQTLKTVSAGAPGCFVYLTSHGAPQGVVIDDQILPPSILGLMLDNTCGAKPTVVVISACFSGVFVPALAKPNRMIFTAARPDRTSFGCGESNRYPFFDECFLGALDDSGDFNGLAAEVRRCVVDRERAEGVSPPSEPQLWIGPQLRPVLPLYAFAAPASP